MISKRVRVVADGSGSVTLAWSTDAPYQSAIESQGLHGASISGLTIRHRSPSVANNYAVFLQARVHVTYEGRGQSDKVGHSCRCARRCFSCGNPVQPRSHCRPIPWSCVYVQGSDLSLQDCDISSSTGTGVGIEGGAPLIGRCTVHNCERHGVAIFSELGGSGGVVWLGLD